MPYDQKATAGQTMTTATPRQPRKRKLDQITGKTEGALHDYSTRRSNQVNETKPRQGSLSRQAWEAKES